MMLLHIEREMWPVAKPDSICILKAHVIKFTQPSMLDKRICSFAKIVLFIVSESLGILI